MCLRPKQRQVARLAVERRQAVLQPVVQQQAARRPGRQRPGQFQPQLLLLA